MFRVGAAPLLASGWGRTSVRVRFCVVREFCVRQKYSEISGLIKLHAYDIIRVLYEVQMPQDVLEF